MVTKEERKEEGYNKSLGLTDIHRMEYYSAIKKNEILTFVTIWTREYYA